MHPPDTVRTERLGGLLDSQGNLVGRLDVVHLDLDHADTDGHVVAYLGEDLEVGVGTVGKLEDQVISAEPIEEVDE